MAQRRMYLEQVLEQVLETVLEVVVLWFCTSTHRAASPLTLAGPGRGGGGRPPPPGG